MGGSTVLRFVCPRCGHVLAVFDPSRDRLPLPTPSEVLWSSRSCPRCGAKLLPRAREVRIVGRAHR